MKPGRGHSSRTFEKIFTNQPGREFYTDVQGGAILQGNSTEVSNGITTTTIVAIFVDSNWKPYKVNFQVDGDGDLRDLSGNQITDVAKQLFSALFLLYPIQYPSQIQSNIGLLKDGVNYQSFQPPLGKIPFLL